MSRKDDFCVECGREMPPDQRAGSHAYRSDANERAGGSATAAAGQRGDEATTAMTPAVQALIAYVQHKGDCPKAYDERWINILHSEQHLDDEDMETCHFAACRAWCRSKNPQCTCGLTQALADLQGESP